MSWQDVAAIAIGAVMFAAYLHYIHNVYPRNLTDEIEKGYYTCYDIYVGPETGATKWAGEHEEHDPGDEQPQR